MGTLEGRVALVTGSSRGIGIAIAAGFAYAGAAVAMHGRDAAAVSAVVAGIAESGATVTGVPETSLTDGNRQRIPANVILDVAGGAVLA